MNETTEKVQRKGNKIIVRAASGYVQSVDKLLTLKDHGNGYTAKFHAAGIVKADTYLSFDYAQAEYLYLALREVFWKEDAWYGDK